MAENMKVDVLVIGFGKAGKTIAMKRAASGDRVALVEQSSAMYGGTCINIGCVPTKALLTDAERHHAKPTTDDSTAFLEAIQRRGTLTSKMNQVNLDLAEGKGVIVVDGHASFVGEKTVEVTGGEERMEITGETVIINTGAEPVILPLPGADLERVIDSTQAQRLEERPDSLLIVGGGPIGMEFATYFAKFGIKVTVIDTVDKPFANFDRDIAEHVGTIMDNLGITWITGAQVTEFRESGADAVTTVWKDGDGNEQTADTAQVLVAVGRKPATKDLGLDKAGIELTERGAVAVDKHLRTNVEGVYAAGDVNGGPQFTYVSFDDHRVILSDRWGDGSRTTDNRVVPTTTFIDPPLATVGLGEDAAREEVEARGNTLDVKAADIKDIPIMPRPKILGKPEGHAKILVERETDRIVGATLLCVDAQELINTLALAMSAEIPASTVGGGIYTHPSSSEVFNALLG